MSQWPLMLSDTNSQQGNEGVIGLAHDSRVQTTPRLVGGLKNIQKLVCGENHVLALDDRGRVYAWGSGTENQLGRRMVEGRKVKQAYSTLQPKKVALPNDIVEIGSGQFHWFAVRKNGELYSWGFEQFRPNRTAYQSRE